MDIKYFKEQIHEELEGAKQYIEKAIEAKISHPTWVRTFALMSDMEIEHATHLMKMMESCIRDMNKNSHTQTATSYGSSMTKIDTTGTSSTPMASVMLDSPENTYKNCMKEYGEVMTYVTNMKRGL